MTDAKPINDSKQELLVELEPESSLQSVPAQVSGTGSSLLDGLIASTLPVSSLAPPGKVVSNDPSRHSLTDFLKERDIATNCECGLARAMWRRMQRSVGVA